MEIKHIKKAFYQGYRLSINRKGILVVTTGRSVGKLALDEIISNHHDWISNQLAKRQETKDLPTLKYFNGEKITLLSDEYTLSIISKTKKRTKAYFHPQENIIIIETSSDQNPKSIQKAFEKLLKEFFIIYLQEQLSEYCAKYNYGYQALSVKKLTSRWGSCNNFKALTFNLNLIFCPLEQINYVIFHELCHTVEMNHSDRFWRLVMQEFPSYKKNRKWFRQHGNAILALLKK